MRCWVCGSDRATLWKPRSIDRPLAPHDLQITDDNYGCTLALWQCRDCQFIFADDRDLEQLTRLYEQLADPDYVRSCEPRALQMRWIVRQVLKAHRGATTLLDVGAGAGLLVDEARRRGLAAVGVEPSRSLVDYAGRLGIDLLQGVFPHPDLTGRTFDAITIVDVIEHVTDPVAMLRDAAAALNPGGVIVVVTPDAGSLAARVMGTRWWHFRLAHIGYFKRASLQRAAAEAGLIIEGSFTPRWYFKIDYVAERLTRYLPVARLNRIATRRQLLRRIYDVVIPLTPHDSLGVLLRPAEADRG